MNAHEAIVLVAEIEQYLPLVKKISPLIEQFGSDIMPTIEKAFDGWCDLQIRQFNRFLDNGMSREEAMKLVMLNVSSFSSIGKK